MVLTRAQEQRLSRLEEMCAERSKMIVGNATKMKQLADMVEAFSRSIAGKSEFPRFEDDCDDDQPPNGEFGEPIEHRMGNLVPKAQEENPRLENHEGWEQIGILEVEGDVERDQKMISDAKTFCAHKVFDKMSQHQGSLGIKKKKKGVKSWKFKYKKGNKKRDLLLLNGKASLALRAIGTGLETIERDSSNQEKSKLCTEDKGELKGCLERLQASVLLKEESESMVVNEVKAEFKTFDKKSSNKTLSLEDGQDDEHEQNQVIKLISSLKNRIWEPGGVLIEHDRWKELEKCYKHGRLMRLMQPLSSMWWQLSKSRELERLGACSFVDIKMWLDLCSREYKNHMLLLDYHGIEMQVLSCLLEIGFRTSMSMGSKTRLWIRDIECIRKRKVDLSLITHCKMSMLEYTKEVEILSEKTVVDRIERWMEIQIKAFTSRDTKEDKSWITFNKIIDSVKETVVELMQKLGETGLIMKFPSKVKDALDGLAEVGFKIQVMRNTKLKFSKRWWFKYKCVKGIQTLQILLRYKSWLELEEWFKIWSRGKSWRKQKEIQQFTIETEEEMEDISEEDLKQQQGDSEPLVTAPDFDANVELAWKSNSLILHFETRVWDPGRSLIKDATPREFPFHSSTLLP